MAPAIGPVKQYTFTFVSDGVSLEMNVDASIAPIEENFAGNLPINVYSPLVTGEAGAIPGVTASLLGTTITFAFPTALPQLDGSGNLILYSGSFYLQYNQ